MTLFCVKICSHIVELTKLNIAGARNKMFRKPTGEAKVQETEGKLGCAEN